MRVLFINDSSITNPVVSSQGLPHLHALAAKGHTIFVFSIESRSKDYREEDYRQIREVYGDRLRFLSIHSLPARWISVPLQLFFFGPFLVFVVALLYRIQYVHVRSYVPAFLGLILRRLLAIRFLFDMRGLYVDEYISKGATRDGSPVARFMRWVERRCILRADALVVVSQPFRDHVASLSYVRQLPDPPVIEVIPTSVDFERFVVPAERTGAIRDRFALQGRDVLIYSGSLSVWQLARETVEFFLAYRALSPAAFLLVLTYSDPAPLVSVFERSAVDRSAFAFLRAGFEEVPVYFSVGTAGILLRRDELLNRVASPLKFGEYLAAGMPVVLTKGIGDTERIVAEHRVGVLVDELSPPGYAAAASRLKDLLREPEQNLRARCRQTARRWFALDEAVERYRSLYQRAAGRGGREA